MGGRVLSDDVLSDGDNRLKASHPCGRNVSQASLRPGLFFAGAVATRIIRKDHESVNDYELRPYRALDLPFSHELRHGQGVVFCGHRLIVSAGFEATLFEFTVCAPELQATNDSPS